MKKMDNTQYSKDDVIHLCWTGGWDSTFRLLQLLFNEKKVVQPHYIIIPQECAGKEIDTIHNIRRQITRKHPEAAKLLMPISFIDSGKIAPNEDITGEYEQIRAKQYISAQYEILARYCKQIGIDTMELSVLKSETFEYFKSNFTIFKYFELPLLGLTKPKMYEIAKENGWTDLMKMTWFCRRPRKGRPCGFCGPCTDAVIAGMGWRLPWRSRIITYLQLPFRKWWRNNYHKRSEGILKRLPKLLEKKV